jgi:hypothetical protein
VRPYMKAGESADSFNENWSLSDILARQFVSQS